MNKRSHFSMTGFIIALILVSMFSGIFAIFITQMDAEYNLNTDSGFSKYQNITAPIIQDTEKIKNVTETEVGGGNIITQFLDIVGAFFSGGWTAITTSFQSFRLFEALMSDAGSDVPEFSYFVPYVLAILIIIIFLGIGVSVLLKVKV